MEISKVLQVVGDLHLTVINLTEQIAEKDKVIQALVADNNRLVEEAKKTSKNVLPFEGELEKEA